MPRSRLLSRFLLSILLLAGVARGVLYLVGAESLAHNLAWLQVSPYPIVFHEAFRFHPGTMTLTAGARTRTIPIDRNIGRLLHGPLVRQRFLYLALTRPHLFPPPLLEKIVNEYCCKDSSFLKELDFRDSLRSVELKFSRLLETHYEDDYKILCQ